MAFYLFLCGVPNGAESHMWKVKIPQRTEAIDGVSFTFKVQWVTELPRKGTYLHVCGVGGGGGVWGKEQQTSATATTDLNPS